MGKLARAGDGGAGEGHGEIGRQPLGLARCGERLDQVEDIGRPRARDRGHRIHLMLALEPDHLAHRREEILGQRHLRLRSDGLGSVTQTVESARPRPSQPSSIAEPIFPQPSSTSPRRPRSARSIVSPVCAGKD